MSAHRFAASPVPFRANAPMPSAGYLRFCRASAGRSRRKTEAAELWSDIISRFCSLVHYYAVLGHAPIVA